MNDETKSTALATLRAPSQEIRPVTIPDVMSVGVTIFKSGMFPKTVTSPEAAATMIFKSLSLGQDWFWGFDNMQVVEGQLSLKADAVLALVLQDPACEYCEWSETTNERATLIGKRRGRATEVKFTYTIEDARQSLLLDRGDTEEKKAKSNWNRYRPAMLRARCVTSFARMYFPGATKGMKSADELHDERAITVGTHDPKTGEVLEPGQTSSATTPPATPPKDWKPIADVLAARIKAAKTPPEFKEIAAALKAETDMPPFHRDPLIALYDEQRKSAKAAAEAKP